MKIHYITFASPFGAVLVGHQGDGICALLLAEHPSDLVSELQTIWPAAELQEASAVQAQPLLQQVKPLVENPQTGCDLSLKLQGTAFQKQVWQALLEIPMGTTVSYSDLAHKIGKPKAIRAVASACAANKIAVLIPCHRVVRHDGSLSGYRWGLARKAALLEHEKSAITKS